MQVTPHHASLREHAPSLGQPTVPHAWLSSESLEYYEIFAMPNVEAVIHCEEMAPTSPYLFHGRLPGAQGTRVVGTTISDPVALSDILISIIL